MPGPPQSLERRLGGGREVRGELSRTASSTAIYLHSSAERQRTLAEAVGQVARLAFQRSQEPGL